MIELIREELFGGEVLQQNQVQISTNTNILQNELEKTTETPFNKESLSSLEAKDILTRQLIQAIVDGEIEFITRNCEYAGAQLAILQELTKRLDGKVKIEDPLIGIFYLESELLEDDANTKKIQVPIRNGLAYKEEIAFLTLQIKYQLALKSKKFDQKSEELIQLKKKMKDYYKRHCNRIGKADKAYLEVIKRKLEEIDDNNIKVSSYRAGFLKEERNRTEGRIEKREDDTIDVIDDNLDKSASIISKRQFIKGFKFPYNALTQTEAECMLRAYENKRNEIISNPLPEKNRLYIKACNHEGIDYFKFTEGEKVKDKGLKPKTQIEK